MRLEDVLNYRWEDRSPRPLAAMSSAVVRQGKFTAEFSVTATADADVGPLNVAHGLGATPQRVIVTQILLNASAAGLAPIAITVNATNIVVAKANVVGSGNAAAQVQLSAELQHSLVQ